VTGNPKDIERFFYGEFAASAVARYRTQDGIQHEPQFAYVLQEPMLHPKRLAETVAANRGMWIKVFDNLEEALERLGVTGTASAKGGDGTASSVR
jgi:type II secretory pathway component PulJ